MTNCIKCENALTAKEIVYNKSKNRDMICYKCAMAAIKEAEKPNTTVSTPEAQKIRSMALSYAKDLAVSAPGDFGIEDIKTMTKTFAKYIETGEW